MKDRVAPETIATALGPIQVARVGGGPAVMFIHGTPGGWDSSVAMGQFLAEAGFEVIAPSRPGYLGTPLDEHVTIDEQADLYAALLDALGHEQAAVVTWSGGGPSGYRLAVRNPARVSALVAFAAVSHAYDQPVQRLADRLTMRTRIGNWLLRLLISHAPRQTVSATLHAEGDLTRKELKRLVASVCEDEQALEVVLTVAGVVADYANRRSGVENDLTRLAQIESVGLEAITAPTLVIHGDADTDVSSEHSDYAAATIPHAEQLVMPRGTHLCLFAHPDARSVQQEVVARLCAVA
jgi:pimeloyl-ACP methyl ester carboxylesterase